MGKNMGAIPIAVAEGDGIGPEIMAATLEILKAAGAPLEIHKVEIGERVYKKGCSAGIEEQTWEVIRGTKAFLKAPITTPQGGGFKSLNVTVRTTLGLYANVRPCVSYAPFVRTKHPDMDVVIIRENEEDLYTGIEYRTTPNSYQALKMITTEGCEKIVRYAFEYAKAQGRKKVTCFTKDNILKMTDGHFHKLFDLVASEYKDIENEHWIVDIGAAKLADSPNVFDVIVLPNLYGDILSDVAAQIAGSVGLAGSANIGDHSAMFEAIHGSAPRHAGQNSANPSGLLLGALLMLSHIGLNEQATLIHNAWLKTLEDGIHTYDIFSDSLSKQKVGTKEFSKEVIKRLGEMPDTLHSVHYGKMPALKSAAKKRYTGNAGLVGADIFVEWTEDVNQLACRVQKADIAPFTLKMIGNRGVGVWPCLSTETSLSDSFRLRFMASLDNPITGEDIVKLQKSLFDAGLLISQAIYLRKYEGLAGYTLSQDEQ